MINRIRKSLFKSKKDLVILSLLFVAFIFACCLFTDTAIYENLLYQRVSFVIGVYLAFGIIIIVARTFSDEKSLIIAILDNRYKSILVLFIVLVLLHVHGYSIDMWSSYIPNNNDNATLLFGTNRAITSDNWAITIPYLLNQSSEGFPTINTSIMESGLYTELAVLPSNNIVAIGLPHFWGMFLGNDIGISWMFWFIKFSILLTSYELFMYFSKEKKMLSLVFALAVAFSPLLQWWSGHNVILTVVYMQWCVVCVIKYLKHIDSKFIKIFILVFLAIGMIGFVMVWYPALQVSLGYIALIIIIYVLYDFIKNNSIKKLSKNDYIFIILTIIIVMLILVYFLIDSFQYIQRFLGTEFPGTRVDTGGDYDFTGVFYYFYQPLMSFISPTLRNECNWSAIIPFIPCILIIFPLIIKKINSNKKVLVISLMLYCLFMISWLFISYPELLAKIIFFNYVPTKRAVWGIGLLSIYIAVLFFSEIVDNALFSKKQSAFLSLICLLILISFTYVYRDTEYLEAIGNNAILYTFIISAYFLTFSYCFIYGHKQGTYACLCITIIYYGINVVPLEQGVYSLTDTDISQQIIDIKNTDKNAFWLVDDVYPYGNFPMAMGAKSFSATNSYMDTIKWSLIDPERKFNEFYNRYCQVSVDIIFEGDTWFELLSVEHILVHLNVNDMKKLGIDYILSKKDYSNNIEELNLNQVYHDDKSNFSIYRVMK